MSGLGSQATCWGCGAPLRYGGHYLGWRCLIGVIVQPPGVVGLRTLMDCDGQKRVQPVKHRARTVEVFRCSGCRREAKLRPGDPPLEHSCACGGLLIYHRSQSR
ncbi:MAG: hypothetical protein WKF96_00240 [Solirubrobacteraceae bacterium]